MKKAQILTGTFLIASIAVFLFILFYPTSTIRIERLDRLALSHDTVSVLFLGDALFDRDIRRIAQLQGYEALWGATTTQKLHSYDAVVLNLEGPITHEEPKSRGSHVDEPANTTFTFPPDVVASLNANNISLVNLGNNHILDFGKRGLRSTQTALDEGGISFVVDVMGGTERISTIVNVKGHPFGVVSYNEFLGGGISRVEEALHIIKEERPDMSIVYAHWGDEYITEPPQRIRDAAHRFIDAGADLVVGSHSHVVSTHETYHGGEIYYSLGNFIFDQYWNREVRCGAALEMVLSDARAPTYRLLPAGFNDGHAVIGECS